MLKYFFTSKENIPNGVGFSLYDGYHISWLILIILFIIMVSRKYKASSDYKKNIMRKIIGTTILFSEINYDVILIVTKQFNINYLPLHLCGIAIFLCFYDSIFGSNIIREFLYCACMPGAVLALLFPNWTDCPMLNFAGINSFVVHCLIICYVVMIIYAKDFLPNYKMLPACSVLLTAIAVPIYFFNKIFDTNFLFINVPSEVSPLVFLEEWLGNPGYIFGMMALTILCWIFLYFPSTVKRLHIKKRKLYEELV